MTPAISLFSIISRSSDSESSGSENNANDVGGSSNGPGGRKNEEELKAENRCVLTVKIFATKCQVLY